ncbi:hypothetical protein R3W88_004943 [Solanum pinnatisectum]|uniref:Uncharacterized protein n=1 Tax=Solanum pinnatisectum TaxID=50273 RepID=A0AAV9KCV3_9SOLN|nr:hypothetical protein R3W88_004943 [Solanum pinnatisectum]
MRSCTFFCLFIMMIAKILLSVSSVTHGAISVDRQWNGTGEMDGINWQVSLAGGGNYLSLNAIQDRPPICNEQLYANCIGDKKTGQRPCTDYNNCKRSLG